MKIKRLLAVILSAVILLSVLTCGFQAFAIVLCETQYSYDSPNLSWLKDLIVKEDMESIGGLSTRNAYTAVASYPYRATADSFRGDISYYETLYTLDSDMGNTAYLYMLELANTFASSAVSSSYSDEFIRHYLESVGIVYPSGAETSETKIIARALFSILAAETGFSFKKGTGLYDAFLSYFSKIMGVNLNAVIKFDGDAKLSDLKEYVVAAAKYTLHSAGYDVNMDTPESEVYRLMAVMTIKAQGITIDSASASLDEIKNKYMCAMLGKVYSVTLDPTAFLAAYNRSETAFYMLQVIGKKNGVTVGSNLSYEDAFKLVCEKTTYFNLVEGEFYADILEYNIPLNYKRDKIWIYPQTLGVTSEDNGTTVAVSFDDVPVKESYYDVVKLDSTKAKQTINVLVVYTDANGKKSSTSYKLNIIQGTETAQTSAGISGTLAGVAGAVQNVMQEMGFNQSIAGIVTSIPFELPERFLNIATLLVPSFGSVGSGFGDLLNGIFGYSKNDDSNVSSNQIGGVGGLDAYQSSPDSALSMNFNQSGALTPGQLNLNGLEATTKPANSLIIGNEPASIGNPPVNNVGVSNGSSTRRTVMIILGCAIALSFATCVLLFIKIQQSNKSSNPKAKKK